MDTSGFVTSLLTSLIIFLVLLALHALLSRRPANNVVYYPAKILNNIPPPSNPGIFSWLREAWSASEDDLIKHAGLDAAIYINFLQSALSIFVYTAFFCVPILLPISGTDKNLELQSKKNATTTFSELDKIAMGNVQDRSTRLWAYVIGAYWFTVAVLYVLWKTYKHVVLLRTQAQSNSETANPEQYAILVRDIPAPASGSIHEEVDNYFKTLHPGTYERSIIVTDLSKASKLWGEMEGFRKKLAHAEAVYEEKKVKPTHKTGVLGLYGPQVDSIDYYKEERVKRKAALKEAQISAHSDSQKGAAIAFFNNRAAANSASQDMHSPYANQWTTFAAPEPREVEWGNLAIPFVQRLIRQSIVYVVVALTILFYMIPISFISAIISLNNLKNKLKFLAPIVDIPAVNAILQAYLPQIVLIIFLMLLPALLLKLSTLEGIPSKSHIDRAAAGKFFYFNVFNVFLGVTIAGSLFTSLKSLVEEPTSIISLLSQSLPGQATFFISYIALKFLVGYGLTLSRVVPLIIFYLKKRFLCKTEEEIKEAWAPGSFNYATCVPGDMLVLTISFCYTVISPLILIFASIYFGLGWLLMRNQALNVVVPKYESKGRMWPHIHARILASLFLSQLTMLGYFGVKKFVYVPLLVPLPVATVIFAYICRKFFYPSFNVTPLSATCAEPKLPPTLESVIEAYTVPCLSALAIADGDVEADPLKPNLIDEEAQKIE